MKSMRTFIGQIEIRKKVNLQSSGKSRAGHVSIDGADLYFETKGAGKPVLFIHAGVGDSRMWEHQFEEFSKSYFVIRCDLRGFGQTRASSGTFAHYEDIAALMQYLRVDSACIVGASFGGSVAIDFALTHPEMVTALVVAAPALGGYHFKSVEMLNFFTEEEKALAQHDLGSATELNLKMWVDGIKRQPEAARAEIRERVREMQFNIFSRSEGMDLTEKQVEPPAIDQLNKIAIPTLVLVGDMDVAEFQSISKLVAKKIQNARHVTLSDTAHLPSMEKPEEFNRLVFDFLV